MLTERSEPRRPAVVGISAFYHDSAVAVVGCDGDILFAVQEERFTRVKHDKRFPLFALQEAKVWTNENGFEIVDAVYYENPSLKRERQAFNLGFLRSNRSAKFWQVAEELWERDEAGEAKRMTATVLGEAVPLRFDCLHHRAHALSAFLLSGFEQAVTLVIDGVGEWATTSIYRCHGFELERVWERRYPHSLGLFYSTFTQLLGFKVNSGEYKLMGLAPYGEPSYIKKILANVITLTNDERVFSLNLKYFDFLSGQRMVSNQLLNLFGLEKLPDEGNWSKKLLDLAASAQKVLEMVCEELVTWARRRTKLDDVCIAGGVGLNCVNNSRIRSQTGLRSFFAQPASGDAGAALGAALSGAMRSPTFERRKMPVPFLGKQYSLATVWEAGALRGIDGFFRTFAGRKAFLSEVSCLLEQGKIVGWFQGRSEFGPRALGARSILCRAGSVDAQRRVNTQVKFRESFRPFAPIVLQDEASKWFAGCDDSPFMLETFKACHAEPAGPLLEDCVGTASILSHLRNTRAPHPAVTHVDGSARVQTVSHDLGILTDLLLACRSRWGDSVVINTSFNVRGEPIVETPREAVDCFLGTDLDALAIEGILVLKQDIPQSRLLGFHRGRFKPD